MTNVLFTDLGLSIPLSFIDKCVSTSVDSTIIDSTILKRPNFRPYLIYFHNQIYPAHKKFQKRETGSKFVCGKPRIMCMAHVSIVTEEYLGFPH